MNKNSNSYIILYATVMIVIVAVALAYAAISLQPLQNRNVEVEKMGDILRTIGKGQDADKAPDKAAYILEEYNKYITETFVVDASGQKIEGENAFTTLLGLKDEYDKPLAERKLPVFVSTQDDGGKLYILPTWGKGLWGPVWGYVALKSDGNTIEGVVLDHKGETPGLGAEITTPAFLGQFTGKTIHNAAGQLVSIAVLKGAGSSTGNPNAVDAISGGTLTSRGVEMMLQEGFKGYAPLLNSLEKQEIAPEPAPDPADSSTVNE